MSQVRTHQHTKYTHMNIHSHRHKHKDIHIHFYAETCTPRKTDVQREAHIYIGTLILIFMKRHICRQTQTYSHRCTPNNTYIHRYKWAYSYGYTEWHTHKYTTPQKQTFSSFSVSLFSPSPSLFFPSLKNHKEIFLTLIFYSSLTLREHMPTWTYFRGSKDIPPF